MKSVCKYYYEFFTEFKKGTKNIFSWGFLYYEVHLPHLYYLFSFILIFISYSIILKQWNCEYKQKHQQWTPLFEILDLIAIKLVLFLHAITWTIYKNSLNANSRMTFLLAFAKYKVWWITKSEHINVFVRAVQINVWWR